MRFDSEPFARKEREMTEPVENIYNKARVHVQFVTYCETQGGSEAVGLKGTASKS